MTAVKTILQPASASRVPYTGPAVRCRFENRLAGTALEFQNPLEHIRACAPEELEQALQRIAAAQKQGHWVALALDYELGFWLDPAFANMPFAQRKTPALSAWVFDRACETTPWGPPDEQGSIELSGAPAVARDHYLQTVASLRERMAHGDFYQVNYTFPIQVRSSASPEQLYRSIASRHPVAHAVYFEDEHRSIASFSPELFLERRGDRLTVRPMKGTAPRHADPEQDRKQASALLASTKNRAENLMIVDLLRNDLGRVAVPGSVQVESLFTLEQYPSVWTLTSTIHAIQARSYGLHELLTALFPCGSITGAPKIAAMRAIAESEPHPRGIYCGSLGWLAPDGDFSLNVAIRTLELQHDAQSGRTWGSFGVGGGIVIDSDPAQEWEECLWKARILDLRPAVASSSHQNTTIPQQ